MIHVGVFYIGLKAVQTAQLDSNTKFSNSTVDIVNMLFLLSFSIKIKIIHSCIDLQKPKLFFKESFSGKM